VIRVLLKYVEYEALSLINVDRQMYQWPTLLFCQGVHRRPFIFHVYQERKYNHCIGGF
jgi:hypothetical protein